MQLHSYIKMISVDVNQNNCEYIRVGINRSDQCPRKNIKN